MKVNPRKLNPQVLIPSLQANWTAEMTGFHIYSHLAEKETTPARRRSLRSLAAAEKHHADLWADRLHALGGALPSFDVNAAVVPRLRELDENPYALRSLELEESQDIAKYGAQLESFGDQESLDALAEILKDEQSHYKTLQELTQKETPQQVEDVERAEKALEDLLARRDKGRVQAGSWVGDAIYGVNDGLGSIFGIVSGVSGATLGNSHFVLIAGLAGMVASALSMGAGAYLAAKSEREIYQAAFAREEQAIRLNPVEARELLSLTYQVRGLPEVDADRVVDHLARDDRHFAEALARERLNTTADALSKPLQSAVSGAVSTALGAFIPIVPFFFLSGLPAVVVAAVVSLIAHFGVGAAKSLVTANSWWSSGFEMTWVGALEGAVTYLIGIWIGHLSR